jgi:hypothetical protein
MPRLLLILFICINFQFVNAQSALQKERPMHYLPQGTDFVCVNNTLRFNRALYGTNTAFRVEAGDLPEFAMYMPGMGGNLKFGIINGQKSKWLIRADHIKTIYRPGSMIYEIRDSLLGEAVLHITVLALADAEGMILKINCTGTHTNAKLFWMYGGATGKKFSRDGDIGADPESSFYLKPEYCSDNIYKINNNKFTLYYGSGKVLSEEEQYEIQHLAERKQQTDEIKIPKQINGIVPSNCIVKLVDAANQESPLAVIRSIKKKTPAVCGELNLSQKDQYIVLHNSGTAIDSSYDQLQAEFIKAEAARKKIAERVKIITPDKYINTLGAALSIAADAIWEAPSYMHGAVAWRMRLNGWRGPYVADLLGWHDRAREHFNSYASSQLMAPPVAGVVMDTALHLARHLEKIGTALFSDGYICRYPYDTSHANHYDMNLVFIDELLDHFNWTGDTGYVKKMWPLIKRHLAWEKRNFDSDGDGLYDAYAAIWASDALQYSGGGVTHSSAYNYRANKTATELAQLIGEDGAEYKKEADKIYNAIQKNLWLPQQGSFAEFKDLLGNKLLHPSPGLWTIYQAIDSKVADPFQAYLNLRYIDDHIPHIPVKAKGFNEKGLYLLSTTNWQPYTWSLNNVVLAENLNTTLAYWQGNRNETAYHLWRNALLESMYMSASPGNFEQLSYNDAVRGELYRDFADPIGVAGRTLVEGLFGIQPDALHDTLTIQPGFPIKWNYASLQTPDIQFNFNRNGTIDNYSIKPFFKKQLHLKLIIRAVMDDIAGITVNGNKTEWEPVASAVASPYFMINAEAADQYNIIIRWKGKPVKSSNVTHDISPGKKIRIVLPGVKIIDVYDPQQTMDSINISDSKISAIGADNFTGRTCFVKVKQGIFTWWQAVQLNPVLSFHTGFINSSFTYTVGAEKEQEEKLDLTNFFNDKVTNIFKHQYMSPRPTGPTLQLPTQGIGNWAYPLVTTSINDSGTRQLAATNHELKTMEGIPFAYSPDSADNNILFVSQWDNFPKSSTVPLYGKATEIHLLMAGSTNPMQSRITNGRVIVKYKDDSADTLNLDNPENWWPIEQDYMNDGLAFNTNAEIPERLYLKQGKFGRGLDKYDTIKGFSNRAIDGGAATVLHMYPDNKKELQSLTVEAVANDVLIGLMAVTLSR